jgi:D-proline reductase (dithiol) PrdB
VEVDSFKYVSRLVTRYYKMTNVEAELPIPWMPLAKPLSQSRFGLVTSGGLYHKDHQAPFDLEREEREPTWGDPTFRIIPADVDPAEIGASHHHINTDHVTEDLNILLPVQRFNALAEEGRILGQADHAYSFMGYQGFPANLTGWRETYGPQVAEKLVAEEVDCVLLTAA